MQRSYMMLVVDCKNPTDQSCFLFFLTCPVWVSEVLHSAGCQRVDPNILRSNLLEIRLNVGWIILSDLLIWQFALTNRLQRGPARLWVIFFLMPGGQQGVHNWWAEQQFCETADMIWRGWCFYSISIYSPQDGKEATQEVSAILCCLLLTRALSCQFIRYTRLKLTQSNATVLQ